MSRMNLASILPAIVLAAGCHSESERSEPNPQVSTPVQVRTTQVGPGSYVATEEVVGTVRSRKRAVMEAKVAGKILRMAVAPGQNVDSDTVLVELDVRELTARVEQARAVAVQAEQDHARVDGLFRRDAVTRAEFEAAEARRRLARATVAEAEVLLENARVTAPFKGVVTRKHAELGDLATPGKPLLEIEDPDALRFEADIPWSFVDRIRPEQEVNVVLAGIASPIVAKVTEVEPSADPVSRTFRVRLDLPVETRARSGMFGRMQLPLEPVAVVLVPTNSVTRTGQMELAWVVREDRAWLRLVKTGKRIGPSFEVLSGLDPGEQVVVESATGLRDGCPVKSR